MTSVACGVARPGAVRGAVPPSPSRAGGAREREKRADAARAAAAVPCWCWVWGAAPRAQSFFNFITHIYTYAYDAVYHATQSTVNHQSRLNHKSCSNKQDIHNQKSSQTE